MSRESIGEFEQLVLLAIIRLGQDAYGLSILSEIKQQTGRKVLRPAVYVALRRLEDKDLVRARAGDPSLQRGGRPRKYFEVAPAGVKALKESRRALMKMWDGVQAVIEEA
jgi:PadR family transcriptional regulator PadR